MDDALWKDFTWTISDVAASFSRDKVVHGPFLMSLHPSLVTMSMHRVNQLNGPLLISLNVFRDVVQMRLSFAIAQY